MLRNDSNIFDEKQKKLDKFETVDKVKIKQLKTENKKRSRADDSTPLKGFLVSYTKELTGHKYYIKKP